MKKYFYNDGESPYGPFSVEELKSHKLYKSTMVWTDGWGDWKEASEVDDLDVLFATPPPIRKITTLPPILPEININIDRTAESVHHNKHEPTETTYYTDKTGIRITNSRLIVGGSVYPMSTITAVYRHENSSTNWAYLLVSLLGFILIKEAPPLGLMLMGLGIGLFVKFGKKTQFFVNIKTMASDICIFETEDGKHVNEVYAAVNNSIIQRG